MTDNEIWTAIEFVGKQFEKHPVDVTLCGPFRDALRPLVPDCLIDVIVTAGKSLTVEVRRKGDVHAVRVEGVVCV